MEKETALARKEEELKRRSQSADVYDALLRKHVSRTGVTKGGWNPTRSSKKKKSQRGLLFRLGKGGDVKRDLAGTVLAAMAVMAIVGLIILVVGLWAYIAS